MWSDWSEIVQYSCVFRFYTVRSGTGDLKKAPTEVRTKCGSTSKHGIGGRSVNRPQRDYRYPFFGTRELMKKTFDTTDAPAVGPNFPRTTSNTTRIGTYTVGRENRYRRAYTRESIAFQFVAPRDGRTPYLPRHVREYV